MKTRHHIYPAVQRVILLLLAVIVMQAICPVHAQTGGLNFQGVARNSSGSILASKKISLKFSIIGKTETGNVEYTETRIVNTNGQGIFSTVIGDTAAITNTGRFESINWKLSPKFLKVEMDPDGGTVFTTMGVTQLQTVPYANYSNYSNSVAADHLEGIVPVVSGGTGVTSIPGLLAALKLDNVENTTDLLKPVSTAMQHALDEKLNSKDVNNGMALKASIASPTFTGTVSGINSTMVGLANVDNISDLLKPVSTATQSILNLKEVFSNKSTNITADAASDIKYPSVKAIKNYV
ncbi:MAG: hypothetical protein ABI581_16815, partial [Sediminibacterium sp.]